MKTYRNASDRTIEVGELIYVDGDNVYPANPATPQKPGAIILRSAESGAFIIGTDVIEYGSLNGLTPPDDPPIYLK